MWMLESLVERLWGSEQMPSLDSDARGVKLAERAEYGVGILKHGASGRVIGACVGVDRSTS